jgi:hypothetical protein
MEIQQHGYPLESCRYLSKFGAAVSELCNTLSSLFLPLHLLFSNINKNCKLAINNENTVQWKVK